MPLTGGLYSTSEAAEALGVSPHQVRRWIYDDEIASTTDAGGHHFIPSHEVEYRTLLAGRNRRGRPRTQRSAWNRILSISAGVTPLYMLTDRYDLSRRSARRAGEMLPEHIEELRLDANTMIGGADAAAHHEAPVATGPAMWNLYIARSLRYTHTDQRRLRRVTDAANVVIHLVDDAVLGSLRSRYGRTMPLAVAWLDLADVGDPSAPDVWEALRRQSIQ